jgi:signal transduction histidine kinase
MAAAANETAAGASRRAAWLAWTLTFLSFVLVGATITLERLNGTPLSELIEKRSFVILFATVFPVTGAIVASRRPGNAVGWVMIGGPLFGILGAASETYANRALIVAPGSLPGGAEASWMAQWPWVPMLAMLPLLLQLVPHGRPLSTRWRWVLYVTIAQSAFHALGFMALWPLRGVEFLRRVNEQGLPDQLPAITQAAVATFPVFGLVVIAGMASLVLRFVRSRGDERQQLKWIALGAGIMALETVGWFAADAIGIEVNWIWDTLTVIPVPVAIAVAILKYRLYDIDLVINKAVVYGAMAAFITAVYVAIVVGIGQAVGSPENLGLSILATALVAVAFQPVRERVKGLANRLVYGKRATPYEVLSEFSGGMAHAVATDELLPRMARIVAEGTGAAQADVWLRVGSDVVREASWPEQDQAPKEVIPVTEVEETAVGGADRAVPVRHQGEFLGVISVKKSAGEGVTAADEKLLEDLASQAGLVLRNVRLIEELKTSRQRLVTAQDEERRRLERDLHDGAQQRLVAIAVALRLVRGMADPETDRALGKRIDQASEELSRALNELREFARGIHPTILTERGLGPALESLAERSTVPATVDASFDGRLPASVEATAYFVVSEALANVGKHSKATAVTIRAWIENGELRVDVADDGIGGADPSRGSGLRGLADRVAAVDGTLDVESPPGAGTRLKVRIPVRVLAEATT